MINSEEVEQKPSIVYGSVYNKKERPLTGATVKSGKSETITLFNGSYKLLVEPGWHSISVELEGFSTQDKEIFIGENQEEKLDFQLEEERGTSKIFGYVFSEENGVKIKEGLVLITRTTTNINSKIDPRTGMFSFDDLPGGTYDVWTSILHYEDEKITITLEEDEERRHDFYVKKKRDEEVPWG